jgi:hypothetical protein
VQPIFDKDGTTVAWLQDDTVRDSQGGTIGFVADEALYTLIGQFVCHVTGGFFRDRDGAAIAFVEPHGIGPLTPLTRLPPPPPAASLAPLRPLFPVPPLAPLPSLTWSRVGWHALFEGKAGKP